MSALKENIREAHMPVDWFFNNFPRLKIEIIEIILKIDLKNKHFGKNY